MINTSKLDGVPCVTPATVEASGVVSSSEPRKFEWNLGRLLYKQNGETETRAWTVRVLSLALVFPAVLTALVDLGRGLGFLIGNKNATFAKYFDGKSFSLIDKASAACKALSTKVDTLYKSIIAPPTLEQLNLRSEKTLKNLARKLTDGYRAQHGGYFTSNSSFSSPGAINGEKQVNLAQKEILAELSTNIQRNVTDPAKLESYKADLEKKIFNLVKDAAKDDLFVKNKVYRAGPQPKLADVARKELRNFFQKASQQLLNEQFVNLAKKQDTLVENLAAGVDAGTITLEKAQEAIKEQAPTLYMGKLAEGFKKAGAALKAFFSSVVEKKLMTDAQVQAIVVRPDVDMLSAFAASEIAQNEESELGDKTAITQTADRLIKEGRLDEKDKSKFSVYVLAQIPKMRAEIQAQRIAKLEKEQEALAISKEAEAAINAEKAAQLQAQEVQTSLWGRFLDLIGLIFVKQDAVKGLFAEHDQLVLDRKQIAEELKNLRDQTVVFKGQKMKLLIAEEKYSEELSKILAKEGITDKKRQSLVTQLVSFDSGEKTIELIQQMRSLVQRSTEMVALLASHSDQIQDEIKALATLNGVYSVYSKNHKGQFIERSRKEIGSIEKTLQKGQVFISEKYKLLFQNQDVDALRPAKSVVDTDLEGNLADVEAILSASKVVEEPRVVVTEEPEAIVAEEEPEVVAAPAQKPRAGLLDLFRAVRNEVLK